MAALRGKTDQPCFLLFIPTILVKTSASAHSTRARCYENHRNCALYLARCIGKGGLLPLRLQAPASGASYRPRHMQATRGCRASGPWHRLSLCDAITGQSCQTGIFTPLYRRRHADSSIPAQLLCMGPALPVSWRTWAGTGPRRPSLQRHHGATHWQALWANRL